MTAAPVQCIARTPAFRRLLATRELPILAVLVLLVGLTASMEPRFVGGGNTRSILVSIALVVVLAMGQTAVMLTRGVDVSIGSIMGLAGMTVAILFRDGQVENLYLGTALAILIGGGLGSVNGLLVALCRVPPIVATLGTLGAYRGLTFIVSGGKQVDQYQLPAGLDEWSIHGPLGRGVLPWVVVVALAFAGLTFLLLRYTRFGRDVYALGGNPEAARLRGVPVRRVTFGVYVFSGMAAGLAAVLYASRFGAINPEAIGAGMELMSIAAVVVGGISVFGGSGTVAGVLLGCLLLGTIDSALAVLGFEDAWQRTAYGGAILLAVVFDDALLRGLRRT